MISSTSMFSAPMIIILEMTTHTANIYLGVQLVAEEVKYKQSSVTDYVFFKVAVTSTASFQTRKQRCHRAACPTAGRAA